ncbi:hypothetical protein NZNM25_19670 [Nitrosopumilus zosterae]|uniref:Uncharacterized protein n=1 Tax=Nitrosopumilus zosterae TaxID=718286 RepID=A0A2S2KU84_9ARCH|nr:hypothetical protein [Nitrosopumilus zosterae]BDQ31826.1 hypothetical protein NZOSNM25_001964 [Nitrosopumilus zosterae]GBH35176.1 hypothetical protein NZNM25_19670 [Nitrosopumilus zosterae]
MKEGWARRRWWEFRQGHSVYLIFVLTFINFILIAYRLLIERVIFFKELIPELWIFAVMFIIFYIPAATLIGYWHRKTQLRVETTLVQQQNPVLARMIRTLLDVQTGKASEEEIAEFRKMLNNIEKRLGS